MEASYQSDEVETDVTTNARTLLQDSSNKEEESGLDVTDTSEGYSDTDVGRELDRGEKSAFWKQPDLPRSFVRVEYREKKTENPPRRKRRRPPKVDDFLVILTH